MLEVPGNRLPNIGSSNGRRFPARNDQPKAGERIHKKQQILEKGSCTDVALDQRPRICPKQKIEYMSKTPASAG
ncbi:hypothetical protein V6N13_074325 [Hibiscus sabdariffa]